MNWTDKMLSEAKGTERPFGLAVERIVTVPPNGIEISVAELIRRAYIEGAPIEVYNVLGAWQAEKIWMNGELVDWADAKIHIASHGLHYGSGVFEAIRAYKTDRGTAVFRLHDHLTRLRYSWSAVRMEVPYTVSELAQATLELLRRNRLEQCYIRPLIFYGFGVMMIDPKGAPVVTMIACWPWGAYLPHDSVDLMISKYIRIHPRSTSADAKICGNYVNSILAAQ